MEASRKLGMGAQATMRTAQGLYEGVDIAGESVGLITYMRTDGVQMAREAMFAIRDHVKEAFGPDYVPGAPREYSSKAKNAQEAHEAIRPTDVSRTPEQVAPPGRPPSDASTSDLEARRRVADAVAELDQTPVDNRRRPPARCACAPTAPSSSSTASCACTGRTRTTARRPRAGIATRPMTRRPRTAATPCPPMREHDPLKPGRPGRGPAQHFTQPPPRFSEATLVKRWRNSASAGPPPTASILQVLQDREYVRPRQAALHPGGPGRLVTAFLVAFFERYVDTGFTAGLEERLDEISAARPTGAA
jgi:DNA topoisomerase-1